MMAKSYALIPLPPASSSSTEVKDLLSSGHTLCWTLKRGVS